MRSRLRGAAAEHDELDDLCIYLKKARAAHRDFGGITAIRMPARFRLMVTTSRDELDSRRHHAASLLDLCDIEITGGMPTDSTMPPERLQAGRKRVVRAAAILEGAPPRLIGSRAAYDTTSRRIRAVAQTVAALDGRRQIESEDLAEAERLL